MRIFQPLRSAPVALLWGGLCLSAIGDQLYVVALSWVAVSVLGPGAGYLSALQAAVVLAAVLGIGRWADGWDRRRSLMGADLARAIVLLAVVASWIAAGGPGLPQLVGAVVVLALGEAVFEPALHALLPTLVEDARLLPAANGLLDATDRSARLLGPGLVALLAGFVPVVHFLSLDALTFLLSATAVALIGRRRPRPAPSRPTDRDGVWRSLVRGVSAVRRHPPLGYTLLTAGPLAGAWYATFFLGLPLAIREQGIAGFGASGLGAYGLVISAYGCTNLASTVVFGSRALPPQPQRQMFGGELIVGTGMVLLALTDLLPTAWRLSGLMAAAAFTAVGGPMKDIPLAVLRQTRLDRRDLPSAVRAFMAAGSAGTLLALIVTPAAFARVGVVPVTVACGGVILCIGLVGLALYPGTTRSGTPSAIRGGTADTA